MMRSRGVTSSILRHHEWSRCPRRVIRTLDRRSHAELPPAEHGNDRPGSVTAGSRRGIGASDPGAPRSRARPAQIGKKVHPDPCCRAGVGFRSSFFSPHERRKCRRSRQRRPAERRDSCTLGTRAPIVLPAGLARSGACLHTLRTSSCGRRTKGLGNAENPSSQVPTGRTKRRRVGTRLGNVGLGEMTHSRLQSE